ncbi:cobalt-precorrin-5B (C(1))-methyltransferase CbiD [Desulfovibrio sp. ZJ369]|uniref:cobalt-precorrin-5B (C(1))-methyltransferase CbiD n=1 Tax=Desulfovibrio sp. ZJ369 TaxID=2709793 RepID=UPI0013EA26AE|nr:cobalt-precorrin-5B (C(1))-methyltransferase CbiD [Desulfovibrio sp. ZJ369]
MRPEQAVTRHSHAQPLREGFTTGTAATGAALAALILLCEGRAPHTVRVPLPPFTPPPHGQKAVFAGSCPNKWRLLPVACCAPGLAPELGDRRVTPHAAHAAQESPGASQCRIAHACVRKDGGDDPDATSGALITATVVFRGADFATDAGSQVPIVRQDPGAEPRHRPEEPGFVQIEGGPGVGRVTLPGLPVPVGRAAINPVPQEQIRFALSLYAAERAPLRCPPLLVIVSVPQGREIARRTFNPRLGIVGGISILGTQGTVRPFSHAAWRATIEQGLSVALATGCRTVCLTTGRRSEKLLMARYPQLAPQSFVQVADFARFSLRAAGSLPFSRILWGCFFGKLVKLAQGHASTHARDAALDMADLAEICARQGLACAGDVARCVTAAHALEHILADPAGPAALTAVGRRAARTARNFAGRPVGLHLFHTDGRELLAL